jgi:hypothetical protein
VAYDELAQPQSLPGVQFCYFGGQGGLLAADVAAKTCMRAYELAKCARPKDGHAQSVWAKPTPPVGSGQCDKSRLALSALLELIHSPAYEVSQTRIKHFPDFGA